jgi:hypothetical protein
VGGVPRTATPLRQRDTSAIGAREDTKIRNRYVMRDEAEVGSEKVTASTRAFEELDAQVFPGPGRGATRSEAAASDRWGGPSPGTVIAYHSMVDLVVKHERAHNERRASINNEQTVREEKDVHV